MLIELPSKAWLQSARFNTLITTHVVILFCVSDLAWLTVDGRTIPGGAWGLQYRTARSPGQLHEACFMQPSALHLGFFTSTCASPVHILATLAYTHLPAPLLRTTGFLQHRLVHNSR